MSNIYSVKEVVSIGKNCYLFAIVVLLYNSPLTAKIADTTKQHQSTVRIVNGHSFVTSPLLGDPFISTYVRSATSGGTTVGLSVPIVNDTGMTLFTKDVTVAYFALGFEYQQAITSWMTVVVGFSGGARTGADVAALLAEGVNALYGFNIGTNVKILRSDDLVLTATGNLKYNDIVLLTPYEWAANKLENGWSDTSVSLANAAVRRDYSIGLRSVWVPTPFLGLQGSIEVGSAGVYQSTADLEFLYIVGLLASVDGDHLFNVPISFQGTLKYANASLLLGTASNNLANYEFGMYYTGATDFMVGFSAAYSSTKQRNGSGNLNSVVGNLHIRYDFP